MPYSMQSDTAQGQDLLVTIDGAVAFVRKLLNSYDWNIHERRSIEADLEFIARKRNDKYLNLSIIGEFSSGKSTFINALLRENLLKSDNLAGTTIAKTIIRYAPKRNVIVHYQDGSTETLADKLGHDISFSELRQQIMELTTNPKFTDKVKEVIIEHPAEILERGLAIIDTPGTNYDKRHEETTKQVLEELSDVSLILTDAEKPLPDSLNKFIKVNLSESLKHCVFVATKMDNVAEKNRARQLSYITNHISKPEVFNLANPMLLPYTAALVLGESDEGYKNEHPYKEDDSQQLIQQSYNTEAAIIQRLEEQRVNIIVQKLSRVLGQTLSNLLFSLNGRSQRYNDRHALLEKQQKPDFKQFMDGMEEKYLSELNSQFDPRCKSMWAKIEHAYNNQTAQIRTAILRSSNNESLSAYCRQLKQILINNAAKLIDLSHKELKTLSDYATEQIMKKFWKEFSKPYSELEALSVKTIQMNFNMDLRQIDIASLDIASLNQAFKDFDSEEDTAIGGAVIGASIGTVILPGVGTVIGGALGAVIGALSGKSQVEINTEFWNNKVLPVVNQSYSTIYQFIADDFNKRYEQLFNHVKSQLDDCFNKYHELIATINLRIQAEKRELQKYKAMTDADKAEIQKWQKKLGIDHSTSIPAANRGFESVTAKCPYCNFVIEADDFFCPDCGSAILLATPALNTCPSCHSTIEPGDTFCPDCGTPVLSAAPVANTCPSCNSTIEHGDRFCPGCGRVAII